VSLVEPLLEIPGARFVQLEDGRFPLIAVSRRQVVVGFGNWPGGTYTQLTVESSEDIAREIAAITDETLRWQESLSPAGALVASATIVGLRGGRRRGAGLQHGGRDLLRDF
jgi:hypothetical protein